MVASSTAGAPPPSRGRPCTFTYVRVLELWRYPVKSLQGERLDAVAVSESGFEGDRRFALFDLETGFGLTARRIPELLFASARLTPEGEAEITLPDGSIAADDDALSAWLGRKVQLRRARRWRRAPLREPPRLRARPDQPLGGVQRFGGPVSRLAALSARPCSRWASTPSAARGSVRLRTDATVLEACSRRR
jgi:hypothetical protein